ncbi:MAG: amidase [Burkholderiaceae bacterium]
MHPVNQTVPETNEITAMGGLELSAAIQSKRVSCVEVMRTFLERIHAINPRFNAIVALQDDDDLIAQAKTADQELAQGKSRGWLHGIPQAPKDLMLTRGIVTTRGSKLFENFVPTEDMVSVGRLRDEGAIFIGKTNTPEFGLGSQTYNDVYGATRNAWNEKLCAGGSSGGAGSALALNLLPVNDGSDMMGSLRNPAAFNGIYGFRPSAGRVPGAPSPDQFVQQLGVEGPMGRSPQDCARLLATQAGRTVRAPLSLAGDGSEFVPLASYQPANSRPLTGKRIGWLADLDGYLPMQPGVVERCQIGVKQLESLGASVEPVSLNFKPEALWQSWLVLRAGIQGGNLGALIANPEHRALVKPAVIWEAENAAGASAADFFQASVTRTSFYLSMVEMFETWDFLVMPTAQVFPFDVQTDWPREINGKPMDTYHRWMEVVLVPTMAGLPAMNLPIPATTNDGNAVDMTGIQLIGKPQDDSGVLTASIDFYNSLAT